MDISTYNQAQKIAYYAGLAEGKKEKEIDIDQIDIQIKTADLEKKKQEIRLAEVKEKQDGEKRCKEVEKLSKEIEHYSVDKNTKIRADINTLLFANMATRIESSDVPGTEPIYSSIIHDEDDRNAINFMIMKKLKQL